MAGDLIRDVRRAVLSHMKADAALGALVPPANMHPATVPTGQAWPFTRLDGFRSAPEDGPCHAGATVAFIAHAFTQPALASDGETVVELAEDRAGKISAAMKLALHNRRVPVADGTALLRVRSVQILSDPAEAQAYHAVVQVEARAIVT